VRPPPPEQHLLAVLVFCLHILDPESIDELLLLFHPVFRNEDLGDTGVADDEGFAECSDVRLDLLFLLVSGQEKVAEEKGGVGKVTTFLFKGWYYYAC
jgi:hypothetical protein